MTTSPVRLDPPIIGSSRATVDVIRLTRRLAATEASVLITGESGTGKELVARNLHSCGGRRRGPFVAVNCAALNPGVLESELFGHGRGSFTGAVNAHAGLFEQADRGTLFLDEIGEVPGFIQAKLLRTLQDREVRRLGSSDVRRVDVRLISATNSQLEQRVNDGTFRLDLYYRLNVVQIELVPLRERTRDIFDLIPHYFGVRSLPVPRVTEDAREAIAAYHWPGNTRELLNEMERLVALYPDLRMIDRPMLSPRIVREVAAEGLDIRLLCEAPLPRAVGYLEENILRRTLEQHNWNKSASARVLGLSRQGLLKKIKRYGIVEDAEPTLAADAEEVSPAGDPDFP